jgi:tetratricopeptide (TPR) repeat protein
MKLSKDAKVTDYYSLARAYYYSGRLTEADSAALKTNEMNPKWASAWMLRAQINANIDSSSQEGRAKPFYEKFIEIAVADSANPAKYQKGLVESYGYLAYFFILKKDNANALVFLKKKMELPLDSDDKKNVQKAIDQLEGRGPKGNKK